MIMMPVYAVVGILGVIRDKNDRFGSQKKYVRGTLGQEFPGHDYSAENQV
jgi:hypothetical protein